jgi:hypothetical protein
VEARLYVGRHFAWLKYFTYQLVPVLAPNYCISRTFFRQLKLSYFLRRNTPINNKSEVTFLSQLILFSYYYADETNYCTLGFIFIYRSNIPYHFPSCVVRKARQIF